MPDTLRKKKHQQHGSLLLRKSVAVAARPSGVGIAYRRVGQAAPVTPVPTWKLYQNPSYQTPAVVIAGEAVSDTGVMDQEDDEEGESDEDETEEKIRVHRTGRKERAGPKYTAVLGSATSIPFLSARKLAASFWEGIREDGQDDAHSPRCGFYECSPRSHLHRRPSPLSTSVSPESDKHGPSSKAPYAKKKSSQRRPSVSPPLKAIMLTSAAGTISPLQGSASKVSNLRPICSSKRDVMREPDEQRPGATSPGDYSISSSRSHNIERTQVHSSHVDSPFSEELKRALSKVQKVEAAQITARKEVDSLLRRCTDEVLMLRTKEQEKVQAAMLSMLEHLDRERKAKRSVEMENKRLTSSLADANKEVSAAKEELEKERKSRQLMEDVCDELAKEIGEDKTEAEELKRELAKVRDEIEEERKTLQVTEAWREERVQMKLSEAKLELEERCVALDNLKLELELFLTRGGAHGVEACLDREGENLREAVEKLQEETSESVFFMKDAEGFVSRSHDITSEEDLCSRKNSCSSDEDQSMMHDRDDVGWKVKSDRFAPEEYDWLASPGARVDEHGKQWDSCMPASRRCQVGMKSYGSKVRGLNILDGQSLGRDSWDRKRADSDNSRGGGDCPSELGFSYKGTWSADCGHSRQWVAASRSASEGDVESERGFSPMSSNKVRNRSLKMRSAERRHGAVGVKHCATRAEQYYDKDSCSVSVLSQTKHHTRLTEDEDSGFSSFAGYSPVYKAHLPSPERFSQKEKNLHEYSALSGRKAACSSVDWSKPYKRNSLQAKLLLEDILGEGKYTLKT